MERQIATTKEQSQRLLRCGVSADTADMCYQFIDECVNNTDKPICNTPKEQFDTIRGYGFGNHRIHITPAWSLSALMTKILPSNIRYEGHTSLLEITSSNWQSSEQIWEVAYDIDLGVEAPDPIEACVLMVEKLVANGYKLNEQ